MKYYLTIISLLILGSCEKELTPFELKDKTIYDAIDNLKFGCKDIAVEYYFKGTIDNKAVCYGDYTNDPKTGEYYGVSYFSNIFYGTSLDISNYKGKQITFNFRKDLSFCKDDLIHSLEIQTPLFQKDSLTTYSKIIDSLFNVGDLKIRTLAQRDKNENFNISISLDIKKSLKYPVDASTTLSASSGTQKSSSFFKCNEKKKIDKNTFKLKFDINCDLFIAINGKFYGNLVGEMVYLIRTD